MASTRFLRLSGAVVASGLVIAACGSDGDSSAGDIDAFCAELADSLGEEAVDLSDDEVDFEAEMAEMERIRDLAPSEVRDDVDVLLGMIRDIEALEAESGDEGDDFAAVLELAFDPAVIEATENLDTFAVEECGIDPEQLDDSGAIGSSVDDDSADDSADDTADEAVGEDTSGDDVVGPVVSEAAEGVPDPLFDPFFDDEVDLGVASYQGAQYYLDVEYTDAPWRTRLGSWLFGGIEPFELGAGGVDLTDAEATEVCNALSEYLAQFSPDGTVVVSTYSQNDDGTFTAETELLRTTASEGC